jgi:hypothetical protein
MTSSSKVPLNWANWNPMRKVVKSKAITVAKQKEAIDEGSGSRGR